MKFALIFIPSFFIALCIGQERSVVTKEEIKNFSTFTKAYEHVRRWEGNYSNLEHDSGGETYAGITRKFNQNWDGWEILNNYKKTKSIEWNTHIPEMEPMVEQYYYRKWKNGFYDKIKDPKIAIYLFDYANTGPVAIKQTQKLLTSCGHPVKITTKMDMNTVRAINKMNPKILLNKLMDMRKSYYFNVTVRKPELNIFLRGWINRAESVIS